MFRRDKILSKISNLGEHKTKKERSDENIMDLLELIQNNKEWIFSGVGVAIVILIGKIIPANCFGTEKGTIALSVNCGNKVLAIPKECERLRLGGVTFKKAGKELYKIVSVSPQEDFWEELALPYFESC